MRDTFILFYLCFIPGLFTRWPLTATKAGRRRFPDGLPFRGAGEWFVYPDGATDLIPNSQLFAANTCLISLTFLGRRGCVWWQGRQFAWSDDGNSLRVALINQTSA